MRLPLLTLLLLLRASIVLATNSQDEQVVRNAYAKLAYAVQSRTVYTEARKNPALSSVDLAKKLQANELRFDISEMSSGSVSDITSRPYSDFVTRPDQDVLHITHDTETLDENGKHLTSYFAIPQWASGQQSQEDWDTPLKDVLAKNGNEGKFARYVTATITVRFHGRSRTYHALWLFGSNTLAALDLVTSFGIAKDFLTESVFPSVLTDTAMRSHPAVNEWLNSTQRYDASCKSGKLDVCCDSAMHCGVSADDLRSTKPAPNTTAGPKGGL